MPNKRINEIDLLRFVAAMSVVIFHYAFRGFAADGLSDMPYPALSSWAKYGYLGLDLFFMISGFVILMTAANGSLRKFVTSRIARLYPAFWACCTLTFLVALFFGAPNSVSIGQYLVNLTMLSEFVKVPSIDGVYWSLFIEIRFYLLVALVLILGQIKRSQSLLALWLGGSILLQLFPMGRLNVLLVVEYSTYFIAGATCFLIWSRGFSKARGLILLGAWGLALVQADQRLEAFRTHYQVPMNGAIVAGIVTTCFTIMLAVACQWTGALGRVRWVMLGAVTYPLYLLHQNIGFAIFNAYYPKVNAHLLLWGTIALMIGISYAIHRLIEKPLGNLLKGAIDRGFHQAARILGNNGTV
jgi:peptidoglycan/LPS O-acetylase OafA/YrhL